MNKSMEHPFPDDSRAAPLFDRIREMMKEEISFMKGPCIPDLSTRNGAGGYAAKWIRTFEEYDDFLARVGTDPLNRKEPFERYVLDMNRFIKEFGGLEKLDPFSREYAEQELRFFEFLSGCPYSTAHEGFPFPMDQVDRFSESELPQMRDYIEHSRNVFIVLSALRPKPGQKVLELGIGMGNLQIIFGKLGCRVYGLDANEAFLAIAKRRLQYFGADIGEMLHGGFNDVERFDECFDFIVFDAAFHHCIDPVRLLERLREKIAPRGRLVFLHEPIAPGLSREWGLVRNDGEAAYAIRRVKWYEAGFHDEFFKLMLRKTGWRLLVNRLPQVVPPAYIAEPA